MPRRPNRNQQNPPNPPPPDISDVIGTGRNSPGAGTPHSDSDGDEFMLHQHQAQQQPRRDENSISFRHFLQQQSDVVPTRHRSQRNGNPGSAGVDLFDIHIGLPDFVQDHLVVEGLGNNNVDLEQSLDLSALADCIPISSHNSRNLAPERGHSPQPFLNPEELGACGGVVPTTGGNWNPLLPDFLSDGPMHCDRDASNTNPTTHGNSDNDVVDSLYNPLRNRIDFSHMPPFRDLPMRSSSLDVDPHHLERLRREVLDKTRRISELESEVSHQQQEINSLRRTIEDLMLRVESNSQRNEPVPNGPVRLHREAGDVLHLPRNQNGLPPENNSVLLDLIGNTESLAIQLAESVRALRGVANPLDRIQPREDADESTSQQQKQSSQPDSPSSKKS